MPNYRHFFITLNNYTDLEYTRFEELETRYLLIAKEVGKKSGQPHLHVIATFENARSWDGMKKLFPRANIQKMNGTHAQAREYCIKEGDFVERGKIPQQGKRSDIIKVKEEIADGSNMRDIIKSASNFQTIRIAETLLKYYETPRDYQPIVKWFWGATGTGKTYQAYNEFQEKDKYVCMDTSQWWEGYDGQEYVIIDELREDFMKYQQLLKLLDRYEYRIQVKGSSRQFKGRYIIITSHFHPHQLFSWVDEDLGQLYRRLEGIYEFRRNEPTIKQVYDIETRTLK